MNALRLAPLMTALSLSPALAAGGSSTVTYACTAGQHLMVTYLPRIGVPNRAHVTWAGKTRTLPPTRSADGARYSNGRWTWWSRGQGGFLQVSGKTVANNCVGH